MNPIAHIFSESDKIFTTDLNSENGHYKQKVVSPSEFTYDRNFFCINPIRGQRRLKDHISQYRNFLFESDVMPLQEQFDFLHVHKDKGLFSMATFSGGKSIHFIISCADTLTIGEPGSEEAELRYKGIWLGLHYMLTGLGMYGIDQSNKNPATLSRTPNAMRGDIKQALVHIGQLQSSEYLKSIEYKRHSSVQITPSNTKTFEELEQTLQKSKHDKLRANIQNPLAYLNYGAGNYPLIFRYALWLLDETNAPLDVAIAYFEKYFTPHLIAKNYDKDWKAPIIHAYKHKGLL